MRGKRGTGLLLSVLLGAGAALAGCGNGASTTAESPKPAATGASATSAPVKITMYMSSHGDDYFKTMAADFTKKTGIQVDFNVVPGDGDDRYKKIDVDMISGGTTDLVFFTNPLFQQKYTKNGWLYSMDDLIKQSNYNVDTIYGKYLTKHTDGKVYALPTAATIWGVYYNKKLFDEAGVPYPKGPWTWDQFVETAKKITNPGKGVYGAFTPNWDAYLYMTARQKDVPGYKPDGTSNYEDPAFKSALQFYGDLGNKLKVIPSWMDITTNKLSWDTFMSGKYGMIPVGSWHTGLFLDKKSYPRDWKFGIAPMPANPDGANTLGVTEGVGINKNSKHPKEAFEFAKFMGENFYKYKKSTPAVANMSEEDLRGFYKSLVDQIPEDGLTADDFIKVFHNNGLGFKQEKVLGSAAAEYNKIITQQAELYLVGQKSLEAALDEIKKQADKAIAQDNKK